MHSRKTTKQISVPEVASALALQTWLYSAVDGGLCPLHCCFGEDPEDLHCHLDTLVLMPPQVRLHHSRVKREHTHPCACNNILVLIVYVTVDVKDVVLLELPPSPRSCLASERAKRTLASLLCP